ncbi:MAG TPA: signal recognition particle-docking protein FtsY [Clostridiales bacterium]|nr:signal recognition particle-docking protein FtsY [Clostridiales bacterium]
MSSIITKFKDGLKKTRNNFANKIDDLFSRHLKIDEELYEELEEILISSDMGIEATLEIIEMLQNQIKENKIQDVSKVKPLLKEILVKEITYKEKPDQEEKTVILVVGVNGVGKTTTIGKLSKIFKDEGKKVLVAAGDTFRAAAIEQLEKWCQRAQVELVSNKEGSDPSSVIYDGINAAKARNTDILICDTAGRLHNKKNLMKELNKISRVIDKEYPEANKLVYLVIDANTGQNGIVQAEYFKEVTNIDGIVLTKLDGTSKGGIIVPIQRKLDVPVVYVGLGEGIEDLQKFDEEKFVDSILNY